MFDLRYHITSLTAVFLALGLGILVGIIMVDDDALIKEQNYLINRLEQDFQYLREQNNLVRLEIAEYKKTLELWEQFSQTALLPIIQGRLANRRLAVLQTNGQGIPEGLLENLETAGAEVVCAANLMEFPDLSQTGWPNKKSSGSEEVVKIADQICAGRKTEDGVITIDAVILIGGADSQEAFLVDRLDLPLIARFKELGLIVAAAEVSGTPYSYIPYYRRNADIIIDHINTVPGQVALIWALTGIPGYYGTGPGALSLLPELK